MGGGVTDYSRTNQNVRSVFAMFYCTVLSLFSPLGQVVGKQAISNLGSKTLSVQACYLSKELFQYQGSRYIFLL